MRKGQYLLLVSLPILLLATGCSSIEYRARGMIDTLRGAVPVLPAFPVSPDWWEGDQVAGSPRIVIDLSEQRGYFFKGENLVGKSRISTGRKGFQTPPGRYKIIQKDRHHVSNLYGDYVDPDTGAVARANIGVNTHRRPPGTKFRGAKMPYFMRIKNGYGLHAGYLPGYPASHGCIRMPHRMAAHFYHASSIGTPVRVEP